jgi:hypothetical protein
MFTKIHLSLEIILVWFGIQNAQWLAINKCSLAARRKIRVYELTTDLKKAVTDIYCTVQ